ncbi:hypothetical protein DYB32_003409 [Aphanomyces invadans]|uniref:Uncharacterized protein n=1 Tax=Aphanomyces invadans TaxID=157072 RepID=A0A418B0L1_9STRA|nr:hypothetical protein DYB32_003409 [Aphanomyces invadans]
MVEFLCNQGANVNLQDKKGGNTTIMLTLAQQPRHFLAILEVLLKHQPDLTLKDTTGQTALHLAVRTANAVELLLASKTNQDIRDSKGMTPLLVAAGKGGVHIVELLVHCPVTNQLGNTPLHAEALRSDGTWPTDVAQFLLTSFPEIAELKNAKGKTADDLVGDVDDAVAPTPSKQTSKGSAKGRSRKHNNDDDGPSVVAIQNAKAAMMARVKERAQKRRSLIPEDDTDAVEPIKPQDALSPPVANTTSTWTMALIVAVVIAFFAAVYAMLEASAAK